MKIEMDWTGSDILGEEERIYICLALGHTLHYVFILLGDAVAPCWGQKTTNSIVEV
jgi:hypothetical protein